MPGNQTQDECEEMWPTHAGHLEASSGKSINVRAGLGMVADTCNRSGQDEETGVSKSVKAVRSWKSQRCEHSSVH